LLFPRSGAIDLDQPLWGWRLLRSGIGLIFDNILVGGRALIRSELVQKLCEDHPDLTAKEIERVVSAFFDSIIDQLQAGGRVELRGFGAFSTREREARKGRNPRTGAAVDVNAKRVPYFKPGKEMRERLNV
jgi:integration host factor subunit beta